MHMLTVKLVISWNHGKSSFGSHWQQ